jgi:hypothetical protein
VSLATGELAENKYTGRLYLKTESGLVLDPSRVILTGDVTGSTATPTNPTQAGTIVTALNTVAVTKGGTGNTSVPAKGQILIGNDSGFSLATITAGANITVTNTAGGISIAAAAPPIGFKAKAVFDGRFANVIPINFTWSKTAEVITVTSAAHGFTGLNASWFDWTATTGTVPVDGNYSILSTNITTDTFQIRIVGSTGNATGTGIYRKVPLNTTSTGSALITNVTLGGIVAGSGYWINFNYQYIEPGSIIALPQVSKVGAPTAFYVAFGNLLTINTIVTLPSMLSGSIFMQVYNASNVAVDSGLNTGVLISGGDIKPAA